MKIVGILLAAGRGRRFDASGARNKLLAPFRGGDPVVVASARSMLAILPKVYAVVPPADGGVGDALRQVGCEVTVCEGADTGMAASLVAAVSAAAPDAGAWIIALGDMPDVKPATIAALRDALAAGAGIAAPFHAGRMGNPIGFGARYLPQLLALQGDRGARAIVEANPVTPVAVDDAGIFHDVDTLSDLNKTVTLAVGGQAETP